MDEGAEVKATDSGLLFLRRLAGGESTKEMGDLLLLLTGQQQVPVSCNVPVGRAYLLVDFLTFDLAKVAHTELSPEETELSRRLYQTVDANRDGVLVVTRVHPQSGCSWWHHASSHELVNLIRVRLLPGVRPPAD